MRVCMSGSTESHPTAWFSGSFARAKINALYDHVVPICQCSSDSVRNPLFVAHVSSRNGKPNDFSVTPSPAFIRLNALTTARMSNLGFLSACLRAVGCSALQEWDQAQPCLKKAKYPISVDHIRYTMMDPQKATGCVVRENGPPLQ